MFFTECERLAERHPDLVGVIEQVDARLKEMGAPEVMRAEDWASFLGADPNQVCSVLDLLAKDGLLLREEMVECVHCDMPVPRSEYEAARDEEEEYRCTSCDRPLTDTVVRAIKTYRYGER